MCQERIFCELDIFLNKFAFVTLRRHGLCNVIPILISTYEQASMACRILGKRASVLIAGQFFSEGFGFPVVDEVLLASAQCEDATESCCVHPNRKRASCNLGDDGAGPFVGCDEEAQPLDNKSGGGFLTSADE